MTMTTMSRRSSFLQANKSTSLIKYIESLLKKHRDDPDYAKWDITKPLPKLPVPDLQLTLEKYLRCVMPIVSDEAYRKTEQLARQFGAPGGVGEKLQRILVQAAEEKDNWAYDWWLEDMYLYNKLPLPINSNPGLVFPHENFADEDAQLRFAARLISGIMDYKVVIDQKQLPTDRCTCREKGQPLCMEQYYRLFSSYRVPGVDKDKLVDSTTNIALEPEHVIVMCRNQMFVLDVIVNFTRLSDDQLYHQLRRIKRQAEEEEQTNIAYANVGFLTTMPRNEWAEARAHLIRDSTNRDCIDMVERCIFVVCLDKGVDSTTGSGNKENMQLNGSILTNSDDADDSHNTSVGSIGSDDGGSSGGGGAAGGDNNNNNNEKLKSNSNHSNESSNHHHEVDAESRSESGASGSGGESMSWRVRAAHQMLHGCTSENNSGNRWFDKTMQFIISEDGECGINYEHSPAEGIVVIDLSEHLFRYMEEKRKQKLYRMPSICELPVPRKLRWKISNTIEAMIERAKTSFDHRIEDLDLYLLKYTKFGREFPKKVKTSPDSFIQLSLQLAYYKIYNKLVSTYESASTRRFRKGRVDNIRANSCETLKWVQAMSPESNSTNEEKFRLFQEAVQYQTNLMIDNILGKGMDCHLLALKQIAIEQGLEVPEFFVDESFNISNHFSLSTSQVPTTMEGSLMCYGPVVPNGYGCSYNPKPNYILFAVSAFKSCSTTSARLYADSLEKSLDEMFELCSEFTS